MKWSTEEQYGGPAGLSVAENHRVTVNGARADVHSVHALRGGRSSDASLYDMQWQWWGGPGGKARSQIRGGFIDPIEDVLLKCAASPCPLWALFEVVAVWHGPLATGTRKRRLK